MFRVRSARHAAAIACSILPLLAATAADAKCTRLGFSVNDYGKDGPTKDAKDLLDKYVAKWAADNGVKGYTIGKKTVTCELFLDFGVFDEHTCRAEAPVCWGETAKAPAAAPAAGAPAAATPAAAPSTPSPAPKATPAAKAKAAEVKP
jgi:pyruvate/2-oxoglutarate dehydrogenase complex dihydrolipoamide acyltransferase (E2) component